ncbi:Hypothetical_protein [Hexamita inflata]|uniref:Hypothetical_protein n=1 Tax=Hexamita inflata TaxID=28002 RepID=A0AA86UQ26_9EUKA|nr:Hypothetical protein HINF_LOCUS54810 [Hexamita inflata]
MFVVQTYSVSVTQKYYVLIILLAIITFFLLASQTSRVCAISSVQLRTVRIVFSVQLVVTLVLYICCSFYPVSSFMITDKFKLELSASFVWHLPSSFIQVTISKWSFIQCATILSMHVLKIGINGVLKSTRYFPSISQISTQTWTFPSSVWSIKYFIWSSGTSNKTCGFWRNSFIEIVLLKNIFIYDKIIKNAFKSLDYLKKNINCSTKFVLYSKYKQSSSDQCRAY